jgi:hypothetical protein
MRDGAAGESRWITIGQAPVSNPLWRVEIKPL